ncbi:hypothetical protein SCHPADRAFT_941025 [Schizopora paradoxa]|uniref:SET domain-containing protein n=1 Tax=Schizopora paradoxa TaxID=27342 RepID=A0A0H2RKY7_9AGAM|nr:hypothetical protein SCHPADRAFT_941025 [Schizopora paradoxa]
MDPMEKLLREYGDKEITKESFWEPELAALKAQTEHDWSIAPSNPGRIDKEDFLHFFDEKVKDINRSLLESKQRGRNGIEYTTIIGLPQKFATVALREWKPITIFDMKVPMTHKGYCLAVRTIRRPLYDGGAALLLAVEDSAGDVAYLKLFNYAPLIDATNKEREAVYPVGQVLVIREPTYVFESRDLSIPFIKVESPSDIILFDMNQKSALPWKSDLNTSIPPGPSTGEAWRAEGLKSFKAKGWFSCAIHFTNCIRLGYEIQVSRLNRSEAYLRLGWYNYAYHDSKDALDSGTLSADLKRKAVMRMIKAQYGLGKYRDILETAKELPNDMDVVEWSAKASRRMEEQTTGNFDWDSILVQSQNPSYSIDIGNFTGPVEVKTGRDGSRGTFVTRDVEAGELLMFHKPLCSWKSSENLTHDLQVGLRRIFLPLGAAAEGRDSYLFLCKIIQSCWENRKLYQTILSLYGGEHARKPNTYPPPLITDDPPLMDPLTPEGDIDVEYIDGVVNANAFLLSYELRERGLFELASLINHSCLPSACREFFGGCISVRALRNMKKGEEITVPYLLASESYDEKRYRFMRTWRFKCACPLCEADSKDSVADREKRRALSKEIQRNALISGGLDRKGLERTRKLCEDLKATYGDSHSTITGGVKYELAKALLYYADFVDRLARSTRGIDLKKLSITSRMDSLAFFGLKVLDRSMSGPLPDGTQELAAPVDMSSISIEYDSCIFNMLRISKTFTDLKQNTRAKRWLDAAVHVGKLYNGGGRQTFMTLNKSYL